MWLFNLLIYSLSELWYVEVRISRSVSVSPLEFEITRVDCIQKKLNIAPEKRGIHILFLAHLSWRLRTSYCDHSSSVVRLSVHTIAQLLFWNLWVSFLQTSCGAFCQKRIENLHKWLQNLLQNQECFEAESWYVASETKGPPSLFR